LKRNYEGCAICDSTWGDVWADVEGERTFFCCDTCLAQFQHLVARIEAETGWTRIEELFLAGDRKGRTGEARSQGHSLHFFVAFNPEGAIRQFRQQ
jgi:Ta0938